MSSSPPTTLGKYQIIREIARSNDIVYEAYDPLMNRRVAVKELAMPGGSTGQQKEDRIKRFLREARAVGSLTHPNVMTVFEVGQEGDRYFIAMEYLDGHTLRNEIDTKGFLPTDRAVEIAVEILNGLDYAHSKGVIHRDIKPDNVQMLSDGRIKLTDFGIARLTFEPNLTMDGQVFGTPSYMSPEQVVGRDIDARSDLFSVGVVLYEMIAGQKPFVGDSVVTITYSIMNKEADRPNQCNFAMWQVIEKALDKSPQLRYSNAKEMIEALISAMKAVQGGVVIDPGQPALGATIYPPNPYGAPSANPYLSNPYLNPPPTNPYTPMGNPYGQPAPPPVLYPYNPYQQPGMTGVPPHTPVPTGYPPTPVYYPPPPRKPLLKPEVRFFLGRLLLTMVLVGGLFALVIGLVILLGKALDNPNPSPRQQRAAELEQQGDLALRQGNSRAAEENFVAATEEFPQQASAYAKQAEIYQMRLAAERDPKRQLQLMRGICENLVAAAGAESDPIQQVVYRERAANRLLELAFALIEAGQNADARAQLMEARRQATPNSRQRVEIETLLDQVTNQASS